jgi:hypothetical protein
MIRKILGLAGIVFWMAAMAGVAQAESRHAYIVSIPFAFVMGDQTMSPGEYEVQVAPGSALANENFYIMSLRNRSGRDYKAVATGVALPATSVMRPQLAFQRYGNRAFLTTLRTPSLQIGMPINKAGVQREMAKQREEQEVVTLFFQ